MITTELRIASFGIRVGSRAIGAACLTNAGGCMCVYVCMCVCVYASVAYSKANRKRFPAGPATVGPRHYLSTAARRKHLFRTGVEKRRREWRCDIGNKITTVRRARPLPSLSLSLSLRLFQFLFLPTHPRDPFSLSSSAPDLAVYSLYSVLP